jgi:hypothetical protein
MVLAGYGARLANMKIPAVMLLLSTAAFAEPYTLVYPQYEIHSNGTASGSYRVDIRMHNNGGKTANCIFEVGGQSQSVTVSAYGDANLTFPNVPANPDRVRFSCEAR